MPSLIENFNNLTEEDFSSYSTEDIEPNGFELTGGTLHIFGNTWKLQELQNPIVLNETSVWSIRAFINSNPDTEELSEIQGFGFATINPDGSLGDRVRYPFAGEQPINPDGWEFAYQGAFPNQEWHTYKLEVGKDFYRQYGYYPQVSALFYFNDDDQDDGQIDLSASIYFDDLYDITDENTVPPNVNITYRVRELENNQLQVTYTSSVLTNSSVTYYWEFGDGEISNEANPVHIFNRVNNKYKTVLRVVDENGKWGWDSVPIRYSSISNEQPLPTQNEFKMVFTGDVMMSRRFECYDYPTCDEPGLIELYGVNHLWENTLDMLNEADLKVINLETVISDTDDENGHPTKGILLKADPSTIEGLLYAGIDKVSLANNHSIDYMTEGLLDTQGILRENNIKYSGAGINSYEAYLPENITFKGTNIGFIAISDRHGQYNNNQPFLNAAYNKIGFADAREYDVGLVLNSLYRFTDLNVIELHAGYEYQSTPPGWEDEYDFGYDPHASIPRDADIDFRRSLAENEDVQLIVAHHPHVLQGVEWYRNTLIVHSLGNFIFDSNFPETFASMLFYPTVMNGKFIDFKFRPIFIDHYLTKPATGELGNSILNHVANLSKDLNTVISVDKYTNSAKLIKNTNLVPKSNYNCRKELLNGQLVYDNEVQQVMWQYDLIRVPDLGNLTAVGQSFLSSLTKFRIGSEKVWFGNMEDEGANLWNLNSDDEFYTGEDYFRGSRSIRHNRDVGNTSSILTMLEKRLPMDRDNVEYSIHAAIKTVNSPQANLEIVFYPDRYSNSIGEQSLSIYPSGTVDWQVYSQPLQIPNGTEFFNLKIRSWAPTMGSSTVYWDDVGLIKWEDWIIFENSGPSIISAPNDYSYIQVRTAENLTGQELVFIETFYGERNENQADIMNNQCRKIYPRPTNPQIPT